MTERLLTQNSKIKGSGTDKYVVYNFGIPAFKSATGLMTCPMAGTCSRGCYARQGAYAWSNVSQAFERRLAATQSDTFITDMAFEIRDKVIRAARKNKQVIIRIHDSGDFYSPEYLSRWLAIMAVFPSVRFYAYTKMLPLFKRYTLPANFTVIYSEGGKADHLICTETDRHSRVFPDLESLTRAGYADASHDDLVAALGDNKKIGLIYHGAKSKAWNTGN